MTHTVRLFARYAELFGTTHLEVTIPANGCVVDLIAALRTFPGGSSLPADPFVAVNRHQAHRSTALMPGDEVALLPPLSGG